MATAFSQASGVNQINQNDEYITRGSSREKRISDRIAGLCWKAIFSGFLISLLVYWILTAIGFALGGMGLKAFAAEDLSTLSIGAVLWQVIAMAASLFVGTWVAVRASRETEKDLGVAEGMVTSSIFFWTMALQVGAMVMGITSNAAGTVASGLQGVAARPEVQSFFDDELSSLQLRGDQTQIFQGVALRFATHDYESARNYLARNSNLSQSVIDDRFRAMRSRYDQVLERVKAATGKTMSYAGWILTALLVLGTFAASLGGSLATATNRKYAVPVSAPGYGPTRI